LIPLKDDTPIQGTPWLTLGLIALNTLVFLYQLTLPPHQEMLFLHQYGVVPAWLTGTANVPRPPTWMPVWLTLITFQFLHGHIFHLAGNMLYLWIFGKNIEITLGRLRYLAFYLLGGVLAALAQVLSEPYAGLPMVGASGSIAAILGAYLVLYPYARILVLLWFFFFVQVVRIPALVLLGFWFLMQVVGSGPGVAWMAHVGGFVAGMILVRWFLPSWRPRPWPWL